MAMSYSRYTVALGRLGDTDNMARIDSTLWAGWVTTDSDSSTIIATVNSFDVPSVGRPVVVYAHPYLKDNTTGILVVVSAGDAISSTIEALSITITLGQEGARNWGSRIVKEPHIIVS